MEFLPFSLTFKQKVDGAGFRVLVRFGILVDAELIEVLQLVQAQQAVFPKLRVVDLTLFQQQLAANDAVAGNRVALELDARDVEGLAFIDVDIQRDGLLLVVVAELGDRAEVDIAQLPVGFLQVFQSLADCRGVKPIAVLDGKRAAQGFHVGHCFVAGEGDAAQAVAAAFFDRHQDVDALALDSDGR